MSASGDPQPGLELIWPGKYDPAGQRRQPAAADLARPLRPLLTSPGRTAVEAELLLGDNLTISASLLASCRGQVDLIYVDPPFAIGSHLAAQATLDDGSAVRLPGYDDRWPQGPGQYVAMLAERLALWRELLTPSGSLVVHVDRRAQHWVRLLLDELLGAERFVNEIIWTYSTSGRSQRAWPHKHDNLYWYCLADPPRFFAEQARVPYSQAYLESHFTHTDAAGRRCRQRLDCGKWRTYYPDQGMLPNSVWDIPYVNSQAAERTGYPTQKPLPLLRRLVDALTQPGDLVLDPCCGSGTTLLAAAAGGRHSLGIDASPLAIAIAEQRLARAGQGYRLRAVTPPPGAGRASCRVGDHLGGWRLELTGYRASDGSGDGLEWLAMWQLLQAGDPPAVLHAVVRQRRAGLAATLDLPARPPGPLQLRLVDRRGAVTLQPLD
ncbi:MAG: site-specific DNA-methyltransferase [Fimbriimonadaceae bacterium]|nr:site-specific DNA-methyltransferase [Fimbriimonadaceae bacterium]